MSTRLENLIQEVLSLPFEQRSAVLDALVESLEGADTAEVDESWRAEARRRLAEVRSGAVELTEADEHYDRLRSSITGRISFDRRLFRSRPQVEL